ncbi:hypothetical protein XENTR_v10018146 [Xenopus tropicalis]|nr:hypothetical protein XENTR_v10018146 [Xenopus tropicalis]
MLYLPLSIRDKDISITIANCVPRAGKETFLLITAYLRRTLETSDKSLAAFQGTTRCHKPPSPNVCCTAECNAA